MPNPFKWLFPGDAPVVDEHEVKDKAFSRTSLLTFPDALQWAETEGNRIAKHFQDIRKNPTDWEKNAALFNECLTSVYSIAGVLEELQSRSSDKANPSGKFNPQYM